ncbi:response regulator [Sphingomonas sp.]|jgi:DNA-binding LytR/AlgR family response regulator|uniref:response regulator n=1 Tax=Sphingomonas sp. TaxID=28214 RepID=UPI002EDB3847
MPEQSLRGCRILIVEDEYLLADDLSYALSEAGAQVLGPIASVEDAQTFIAGGDPIDAAVLDVNLRGDLIFPVAEALQDRGVPFAFATGYDQWALPTRFADVPRVEKPFKSHKVAAVLGPLLTACSNDALQRP